MALKFAGVPISDGNETPFDGVIESWLEWATDNIRAQNIFPLSINTWSGINEFGGYGPDMPVRPYVLYWPVGATRWAHMHVIVSERQLLSIRLAAPSGTATLSMTWFNQDSLIEDQISPTMTMLPAKPLNQLTIGSTSAIRDGISEGMYLLSLVDDRYFWWMQQTPAIGESTAYFTWQEIFTNLASNAGASATQDAVASVYSNPKVYIRDVPEFTPAVMDMACFHFGHRLTRSLGGTVKTKTPLNAKVDAFQNAEATAGAGFTRQAGGKFRLADIHYTYPTYIKLLFPRNDNNLFAESVTTPGPYAATGSTIVAKAGPTLVPLVVPPLILLTGNGKTKHFLTTYEADYITGSPANQVTMDTLLAQIASDYYLWMMPLYDIKFNGIVSLDPDAFHDIEWTYWEREVSTRMIPYKYEGLFLPPPDDETFCVEMGFSIGMDCCFDFNGQSSCCVCFEMGFSIGMEFCIDCCDFSTKTGQDANYTVTSADKGRIIEFVPTVDRTVSLSNADLTTCFVTSIVNNSTSSKKLTVTPTSGTLDGLASRELYPCQGITIGFDGTNYVSVRGLPCVIVVDNSTEKYVRNPKFNDTTPAAVSGGVNCKWQADTSLPDQVSVYVAANSLTYSTIQQTSSASVVLGRGSAAGAGNVQEITAGSNIFFSGTTLNSFSCLNANTTSTTVAALTTITDTGFVCRVASASISNTGGSNSLDYEITATDTDNTAATAVTGTVAPGAIFNFMCDTATLTTSRQPIIRLVLKIKDTVAASHTTFKSNVNYAT